jgi:hypothetical protein
MRVLIACEFSGVVRTAFAGLGHDAVSCDLYPSEQPGPHIMGDVRHVLHDGWDLMVAHPPCTHLAVSGARWFRGKNAQRELFLSRTRQEDALEFFMQLLAAPIERVAVENPVSIVSTHIRPPDQIIQPWQYGHAETKATCLWLKNLAPLQPTRIATGTIDKLRVRDEPRRSDRWRQRSRTYAGVAAAMAQQWGGVPVWGQQCE